MALVPILNLYFLLKQINQFYLNPYEVKYCHCGDIDGHQWAPTSQCCPPDSDSSDDSPFDCSQDLFSNSAIPDPSGAEPVIEVLSDQEVCI